jgi:hypothetical protein
MLAEVGGRAARRRWSLEGRGVEAGWFMGAVSTGNRLGPLDAMVKGHITFITTCVCTCADKFCFFKLITDLFELKKF